MDPYDSDSSGFEDEGDFTDTGVLLGYASEEVIEDTITHLGGWPTWLDENTPPPGDFAKCKICNQPMALLLELHGDLPDHFPDNERRLYIFSCPRKACSRKQGSVRALRATKKLKNTQPPQPEPKKQQEQKPEEQTQVTAPRPDLGASLFGGASLTGSVSANPNPFSSSNTSSTQASNNPFATPVSTTTNTKPPVSTSTLAETFADKVRISSPPPDIKPPEASGPWPDRSEFPEPYTQFYMDAEYETLSRPPTPTIPENVTVDNTEEEAGGASVDVKDAFESELDKAFLKFSTRLAHNPEQVLRYEFRGTPLLYSYTDTVGKRLHDPSKNGPPAARVTTVASGASRIPRCEYCGGERVFELQLAPHAISVLEDGREGVGLGEGDAGMEWGTIILGVCGRDCSSEKVGVTGWREEWAGVQWEEAAK